MPTERTIKYENFQNMNLRKNPQKMEKDFLTLIWCKWEKIGENFDKKITLELASSSAISLSSSNLEMECRSQ